MAQQTVIDDQQVAKLINDPKMRRKFPFLAAAYTRINGQRARNTGSCGGCANKRKGNSSEYEAIRKSIGQMDVDKKAQLKAELGGGKVVVKYLVRPGKRVKLTF